MKIQKRGKTLGVARTLRSVRRREPEPETDAK